MQYHHQYHLPCKTLQSYLSKLLHHHNLQQCHYLHHQYNTNLTIDLSIHRFIYDFNPFRTAIIMTSKTAHFISFKWNYCKSRINIQNIMTKTSFPTTEDKIQTIKSILSLQSFKLSSTTEILKFSIQLQLDQEI